MGMSKQVTVNLESVKQMAKMEAYGSFIEFGDRLNSITEKKDILKIKKNFREIRNRMGLTPSHFEQVGVMKIGTLVNIEKASYLYKPSLDSCIRFAYGCGVDVKELLEGIDV